jgi:ribonuclease E
MKENSAAIHVQVPVDVAAFLLNEKRGEILKIETRHRVTAILIPNKHLETPHYKLDRLKHDDPRLEEAHVSYAMAEQADTDIGYSKRQKDEVKPRQEAMVKSITPDTAPIVERKPVPVPEAAKESSGGLFSGITKFFASLFGSSESKAPVVEEKPKANRDKNGDRNRQRNRRGRNGNSRTGNQEAEREERPATATLNRTEAPKPVNNEAKQGKQARPPREEKEGQEPRRDRQQQRRDGRKEGNKEASIETKLDEANPLPVLNVAAPALNKAKVIEPTETGNTGVDQESAEPQAEEGRRRRRGGRNRNRRDRNSGEQNETQQGNLIAVDANPEAAPAFIPVADLLNSASAIDTVNIENKPVQTSFDLAPASIDATSVLAEVSENAAQHVTPTIVDTTTSSIAPPTQSTASNDTPPSAAILEPVTSVVAPEVAPVVATLLEAAPIQVELKIDAAPVAQELPAIQETAAPVQVTLAEPVVAIPVESLDAMLEKAGLVLAGTDPEKLKAAQASAAQASMAPRVVRERKPAAQVADEALVLVETKR